jgi:hypothetical protein
MCVFYVISGGACVADHSPVWCAAVCEMQFSFRAAYVSRRERGLNGPGQIGKLSLNAV